MYHSKRKYRIFFVLLIPMITGCAFFNALYNGWHAFDKGIKTEDQMYKEGRDTTDVQKATKRDYERAVKKAEKAISYYPKSDRTHDDAFYLKGRALYQMGHYAEAVPVFKTLQEYYPNSRRIPESWLYLGMSYAGSGDYVMADETYGYIIDNFPELNKNQEVLILRADLAVLMKGKSQAIVFLEEALTRITDPARRIYIIDRLGDLYIELQMYEKALSILVQKPPFDKAYKGLFYTASVKEVTCHKMLEDFEQAEKILIELIESRHFIANNSELRFELAMLYVDQNRIEDARDIFEDITALNKTDETTAHSWYQLSLIQIDIDSDLDKGEESLKKALEISRDSDLRSKAQRRLNGLERIRIFSDSLENELPDSISEWELRFKLGERYWLDAQLPDSALAQYELILEDTTVTDSLYVKTLYSKAWVLHEMKHDTATATEIFERIIADYSSYEEAKEAQRILDIPITIMVRRDSAEARFMEAEQLRISTDGYTKDVYYSYLITALKYPDINDVAAKALYAAGTVVNSREGGHAEVDTAAAKIFGRLCREYPESDQCKDAEKMLETGQVKGFVDSYAKYLEEKGKTEEDSTALAQDSAAIITVEDKQPLVIPDFTDWF